MIAITRRPAARLLQGTMARCKSNGGQAFSDPTFNVQGYEAFRIHPPIGLFQELFSYYSDNNCMDLALDLGCGTGQATVPLASRFHKVIAIDPSSNMIKEAIAKHGDSLPNVEFRKGQAEQLGFIKDNQVDMIISSQAAHWFHHETWFKECYRVLKPHSGTLAYWSYSDQVLDNLPNASRILLEYSTTNHDDCVGGYWPQPGRGYLQRNYREILPPSDLFYNIIYQRNDPWDKSINEKDRPKNLQLQHVATLGTLEGYLRTWSSFNGYKKAHPNDLPKSVTGNPIGDIVDRLVDRMIQSEDRFRNAPDPFAVEFVSHFPVVFIAAKKKGQGRSL